MSPLDEEIVRELDRLDRRIMAIEVVPIQVGAMQVELTGIKEDLVALRVQFDQRSRERVIEGKDRERQAVMARRWLVGTVFTACTLVIGALALLLPLLIGHQ